MSLSSWLGFTALNAGFAVATGCAWFVVFPDFYEPRGVALAGLAAIALLVATGLHAAVLSTVSRLGRAVALYGAFVVTIVLYGAFMTSLVQGHLVGGIVLALWYGHFFGLPALLALGLVNHWLSPVLCPRRA